MEKQINLEITTCDYACPKYSEWNLPHNYHYVYILENGKDVYIGETNDIIQRTKDHHRKKDSCYKYHFLRMHVITGKHMEETPAKHFENLLIKLMRIDKKFRVTNIDDGERTFYLRKTNLSLASTDCGLGWLI